MKDKTLYKDEWLSVIQRDEWYNFVHENVCDSKKLAILVLDESGENTLIRMEYNPAHNPDDMTLCSITGSIDKGKSPDEMAIIELKEEAGIDITPDQLISLGIAKPYKASDAEFALYMVQVPIDIERIEEEGDGTKGEEGAYSEWMEINEAINKCEDALLHMMILRSKENV